MKHRNALAVFLLSLITFGIYAWYWEVKTKGEMNALGQKIPTAWIWLIPIVGSIWWLWKYSEAVGNVTNNEISAVSVFILLLFLGIIGLAIVQTYFNKLATSAAPQGQSAPPVEPVVPPTAPNPPQFSS